MSAQSEQREVRKGLCVIAIFLLPALISILFRLELFPFSYFPMYSSLSPIAASHSRAEDFWGKPDSYVIRGTHQKNGPEFELPYRSAFPPLVRDQIWWSHFARGMTSNDAQVALAGLFQQYEADLRKWGITGLRLYRVHDSPPRRESLIAEYYATSL